MYQKVFLYIIVITAFYNHALSCINLCYTCLWAQFDISKVGLLFKHSKLKLTENGIVVHDP